MAYAEGDGEGSDTVEKSSEDQQLEILAEAIETATEVTGEVASVESDDCVKKSVSGTAADKESFNGPYEGESRVVEKKFREVLVS